MKKTFKVLISEDTAEFASCPSDMFEARGFISQFCEKDGGKVIENIRRFRPDVVLMDMFMSSTDAVGVMHSIKKRSDISQPIFVIISSFDSSMLEKEARCILRHKALPT